MESRDLMASRNPLSDGKHQSVLHVHPISSKEVPTHPIRTFFIAILPEYILHFLARIKGIAGNVGFSPMQPRELLGGLSGLLGSFYRVSSKLLMNFTGICRCGSDATSPSHIGLWAK
jgi:hypothetical protein